MPEPAILDHIWVALMVLLDPFLGVWSLRQMLRRLRAGATNALAAGYRMTMIVQWTFTIGLVAIWLGADRPAAALGFALPGGVRLMVGAIISTLVLAFLYAQWRAVSKMDEKGLTGLRAQFAQFADLMPQTDREAALFRGVSVTAGVCEEITCRGFLIWYLAAFVGTWPAVLMAALVFGVLHLYQGPAGVLKTGANGLAMGILYLGTGSLLWPMIVHTAVDLHGGAIARHALRSVPTAQPALSATTH